MTILPIFALLALFNGDGLTQEERWASIIAVHVSTPVLAVKAPMEASLNLPGELMVVDADSIELPDEPLHVMLASDRKPLMRLPNPHASVPGGPPPLMPCQGVCVTYSSQGDAAINALTGKKLTDFQAIEALVCSNHPAQVPSGLILQMANAIGIQTIQGKVGTAVVQQKVGLNWRSILVNTVKYGSITALAIMSSGVFGTVSKGALLAVAIGHEAADDLPKLVSPGAPNPDPFLTNVLDGGGSLSVSPSNCQDVLFSGVYEGPNTSFVTGPIQIMP